MFKWVPWLLLIAVFGVVLCGAARAEMNGGEYTVRIGPLELHLKRKDKP